MKTLVMEELRSAEVVDDLELLERKLAERPKLSRSKGLGSYSLTVDKAAKNVKVHSRLGGKATGEAVKALSDADLQKRAEAVGIKWSRDMAGRTIPYWMSDERPDAHGDIVRQNWLFDLFDKNPVMVLSHDWGGLPIGNMVTREVRQRIEMDYRGPALYGDSLFAPEAVSEFADSVYRLAASGFLRSCSVGFVSDKVIDIKDEAERQELGLGRWGYILDQNHLLELSPCTLGANPGAHQAKMLAALAQAKQRGQLQAKDLQVLREVARRSNLKELDDAGVQSLDRRLVAYGRVLYPETTFSKLERVKSSLLDPEMLPKDRRLWIDISIVSEDTGTGDGMEMEPDPSDPNEPSENANGEATRKVAGARDGAPQTLDEKVEALAAMVEELSIAVSDQLQELKQRVADATDSLDRIEQNKTAAARGASAVDEDSDEDDSSSVGGTSVATLSATLDSAKLAMSR